MARDGIFFRIADGIHPKYRTPGRALIFQGVLASIMALSGTFEELTNLFIFAGWIFYGLAVLRCSACANRTRSPRPYRCWGYPWVPGLFVLGALLLTVNIWIQRPGRSSIGLLLILAGLPFYQRWKKFPRAHNYSVFDLAVLETGARLICKLRFGIYSLCFIGLITTAVCSYFFLYRYPYWNARAFVVPSGSMCPTVCEHERLIALLDPTNNLFRTAMTSS